MLQPRCAHTSGERGPGRARIPPGALCTSPALPLPFPARLRLPGGRGPAPAARPVRSGRGQARLRAGGAFSSTMASRLIPKVNSGQGGSPCKEQLVALLSPVGRIEISGCETGVHEIKLPKPSELPGGAESWAACEVCEGPEEPPQPLQQCTAWLRAYFCEPAATGALPVPALHHPLLQRDSFTRRVLWTLQRDVKFGEAVSYKQLADLAGNSRAARAVGGAMRSNPVPILILAGLGCFAGAHPHPVPQGDPQQRRQRQLRRGPAAEGVAAVPREAAQGEAGGPLTQPQPGPQTSPQSTQHYWGKR
ncbi:methylated-DNA--protein-cysteine methyltransferase isoform X2 [Prinia subflava]|uniref:methylated-DNA--protein-cysteine methyltransferase isoform X2 n=1 Tax=Prinia subflava TaxID=208062 RepID=UPI002FE03BD4